MAEPQDRVGLESLAMLPSHQGWPCRLLGARVPAESVVAAAKGSGAAAVVVVSHMSTARRAAVQSLQLAHRARYPVFYAGHSFTTAKSRSGLPGTYLGSGMTDACSQIVAALTATDLPAAS